MKIGIDARLMGKDVRGIGRYVEELIKNLAQIDHENTYTVFTRSSSADLVPSGMETVITDVPWYGLQEQLALPKIFDSRGLDLMHIPHWNAPVKMKTPFVMTIHDMILWEHPTSAGSTHNPLLYYAKYAAYRFLVSHNARRARKIMTVSQSAANAVLRTLDIPPEKIKITRLGIDPLPEKKCTDHSTIPHPPLAVADSKIKLPFILNVGSGYPHKNLKTFFEIAHELMSDDPDLRTVVCGIDPAFLPAVRRQAREILGNTYAHASILGVVSDAELNSLYSHAKVFFFTSLAEGFGLPPLEAAFSGTPIIVAGSIDATREILGNAALLVPPTDAESYISAFERLEHDPELKTTKQASLRDRISHFSWKSTAESTLDTYREALR